MLKKFVFIIFFISLVLGWELLRPGYYSMHDDLQVMRLFEMDRCFKDGQIPCRWAPDLGQNYGQPLFNFYSAFPYYLGELIHLLGFSFIATAKLLFLLSLFLSGVFVYLLAREFMKENAALLAAAAYMSAPYHAVDIFVRGALSESWGLVFTPLVLLTIIRVCRHPKTSNAVVLTLSLAALLATHNITVLISAPIILILSLYFFLINPDKTKQLFFFLPAVLLGTGLAAFFLFPVIFEQPFIQTKFLVTDYFDFRAHFATIGQLLTRLSWGYGPSRYNSFAFPETLSFFIGLAPLVSLAASPLFIWRLRRHRQSFLLFIIIFILSLLTLFMTHARSIFIWDNIKALKFVQFPWRFLGPFSFLASLLLGLCFHAVNLDHNRGNKVVVLVLALLIAVNFSYFRFEKYFPAAIDSNKLSGDEYDTQIKGAFLDYLPVGVKVIPESKAPSAPQVLLGNVDINYFDKRSNYFSSEFDVLSEEAIIRFPIMNFPGWTLYQNRGAFPISFDHNNDFGLITVNLEKGHQLIQAFFEDTPLRLISNFISILSALLLTIWLAISYAKEL